MELGSPLPYAKDEDEASLPRSSATYAVNAQYTAFANESGVFARKLSGRGAFGRLFRYEESRPTFLPVLAFSTATPNLLAIATGRQILVFDVDTRKVKHALKGNGRVVTSAAFSETDPSALATGHVDGSVCVWSLKHPLRPVHHLRALHGACSHVVFNPHDRHLLAACHQDCISVWSLPSRRPLLVTRSKAADIRALHWFRTEPERVISISSTGAVSIYDVQQAVKTFRGFVAKYGHSPRDDEEDTVFGNLDDLGYMPPSKALDLGFQTSQALLVGRNGLIALPHRGHVLYFITFLTDHDVPTELWRLRLDSHVDCFTLRMRNGAVQVVACLGISTQAFEIPVTVLDGMGWAAGMGISNAPAHDARSGEGFPANRSMRPELNLYERIAKAPPIQPTTEDFSPLDVVEEPHQQRNDQRKVPGKDIGGTISITSSLELPKVDKKESEHNSAMPFLSPSIPARTVPSEPYFPLIETMSLPPRASFDSITSAISSAAEHDSDSDDEAFTEQMQGSSSFLPGGVNVPLPRTCGAAFAPSGQLLIFIPAKSVPAAPIERWSADASGDNPPPSSEIVTLFPNFSNMLQRSASVASFDDSRNSDIAHRPSFAMHPSSFDSAPSWSARVSPVKVSPSFTTTQKKVKVSIIELKPSLSPWRALAGRYRVTPNDAEAVAELCKINSEAATKIASTEIVELWQLLSLMLEQKIADVDPYVKYRSQMLPAVLEHRPHSGRSPSSTSNPILQTPGYIASKMSWLQHPFGRSWAAKMVLAWAEGQADIQALACVSTLLLQASDALRDEPSLLNVQTPAAQYDSSYLETTKIQPPAVLPGLPLLRTGTDLSNMTSLYESPIKPRGSHTSSRNPSLPSTPFLDSGANTPPLGIGLLPRHSSRLSNSGSASPEHHRGSFSATFKTYAPTFITEKLSSYGSSPPIRRSGTSPGSELSSSLPPAPGSWSKSVSFASTLGPAKRNHDSLSLAQEDDHYDSDRTIDEASLPHTPRTHNSGVSVKWMNGGSFFQEFEAPKSLIPDELAGKCQIWRDAYAEQLRSWDFLLEAAELDNIRELEARNTLQPDLAQLAVKPRTKAGERGATCSICYCMILGAERLCPACLHTTHPRCLDELVDAHGDLLFTCPAGCGCDCTIGMGQRNAF